MTSLRATCLLALLLPGPALAQASVHVRVLPAAYVIGERRFDDLASLEAHVRSLRARAVAIEDCVGAAQPSRAIAAVASVYRARGEVELRALAPSDPACVYAHAAARRRSADAGAARDDAHLAVDRRGRALIP